MTDQKQKSEALRSICLEHLASTSLQSLAEICQMRAIESGAIIFREGQRYEEIHWVFSGQVTLSMTAVGTTNRRLLTVGEGELLAWSSLLGNRRMTATATADTAVHLIGFSVDELRQLCESNHEIGYRVMQQVAHGVSGRLLATRLQLLDLFSHPNEQSS